MNPNELKEISLLARIEELETSLDEAEALTKRNAELINGYLARITELEAQIAALREIAIEERAKLIEVGGESSRRPLLPDDQEDLDTLARDQLLRELPEAFR